MKVFSKMLGLTFMLLCAGALQADGQYTKTAADTGEMNPQRFCMRLTADSAKVDAIFFEFRKDGQLSFDIDQDSLYSLPINDLKLSSVSSDGYPLITNVIPFPALKPEVIKLYVCPKNSGAFKLSLDSMQHISRHIRVVLIDKYLDCAVEIKKNNYYSFNIDKKYLLSYGDNRFMLVIYQNQSYSFRPEVFGINHFLQNKY